MKLMRWFLLASVLGLSVVCGVSEASACGVKLIYRPRAVSPAEQWTRSARLEGSAGYSEPSAVTATTREAPPSTPLFLAGLATALGAAAFGRRLRRRAQASWR